LKAAPTFFLHSCSETLFQATVATLVSLVLVNDTALLEAARIHVVVSHTAPEKAFAAIAAIGTVVFACRSIAANRAVCDLIRVVQADLDVSYHDVGRG